MLRPVPLDPRVNPGFLKLDLFCRGARLHPSCLVEEDGGRPILRARAGLGSGLEAILPRGLRVNVPVVEPFARESPYEVRREGGAEGGGRYAVYRDGRAVAPIRLAARPRWYDLSTSTGKPMRRVATLQGTYLAVYPAEVCQFWVKGPDRPERENCRFCSVGLNLGVDEEPGKSVDEVMEVVHAARRESGITYVDFNTGHYDGSEYLPVLGPYVRRVKEETGLLVGVQTPPFAEAPDYARLREMGANRVSFCFEVFDPEVFRTLCPGKARVYGLAGYLQAIETCAALAPRRGFSREPWVVNGEMIAGLESPASSIAALDWLTERGAVPTVCVFRPLSGTNLADRAPPRTEDVLPVFQAFWDRCMEHRLPIGVAPGIQVSLVLLPEECRWLVQDDAVLRRHRRQALRLAALRAAFGVVFRARLRRHARARAGR
jgi:hypothetical protein